MAPISRLLLVHWLKQPHPLFNPLGHLSCPFIHPWKYPTCPFIHSGIFWNLDNAAQETICVENYVKIRWQLFHFNRSYSSLSVHNPRWPYRFTLLETISFVSITVFRWITGQCCVPYSPFNVVIMHFREINILVNRPHANWLNELNKKTFNWINLKVGQIYVLHSWWLLWERWKERTGEEFQPRQDSKADNDQNDSNFQAPLVPLSQAATSSLQSTQTSELLFHPSWKTSWLPDHPF